MKKFIQVFIALVLLSGFPASGRAFDFNPDPVSVASKVFTSHIGSPLVSVGQVSVEAALAGAVLERDSSLAALSDAYVSGKERSRTDLDRYVNSMALVEACEACLREPGRTLWKAGSREDETLKTSYVVLDRGLREVLFYTER